MIRKYLLSSCAALAVLLLAICLLAGCMGRKRIDPNQGRHAAKPAAAANNGNSGVIETTVNGDSVNSTAPAPLAKPIETTVDGDTAKPAIPKSATSTMEPPVSDEPKADADKMPSVIETTLDGEGTLPAKPVAEPVKKPATQPAKTVEPAKPVGETPKKKPPVAVGKELRYIQVGVFSNEANAKKLLEGLIADGFDNSRLVETSSGLYKVQAGTFASKDAATSALEKLGEQYPGSFITR